MASEQALVLQPNHQAMVVVVAALVAKDQPAVAQAMAEGQRLASLQL